MKTFRTVIFWLHLICGVAAGIVVFIMSITGVALTYEKQMVRWAEGHEVVVRQDAPRLGAEELLTEQHMASGKTPSGVSFSADPEEPVRVSFGRESVSLDPYTGQTIGAAGDGQGMHDFMRSMILWHRWLGQEGEGRAVGKAITGASNLAFLFIVVSGLYLWWPQKWTWKHLRPILWFRGGLAPKARDFNWHNVMGFWCAIPLAIVVATAVFFSYSWAGEMLYVMTGEEAPQRGGRGGGPGRGGPRGGGEEKEVAPPDYSGLNVLLAKAEAASPGWRTIRVNVPGDAEAPVSFAIDRGNGFRPDLRSTLTLDRKSGEVVKEEGYDDLQQARKIRSWVRFLHTGESFGLVGQTIAGVASLAGCFLVYTGWMLSWRRFRAWQSRRAARA